MSKVFWLRLGVPLAGRFPGVFYRLAWLAGWAAWHTRPGTRRNVVRNLLPFYDNDPKRARRAGVEVCRHVARYYVDLATLPRRDISRYERDHLRLVHPERARSIEEGGPVVVLSAHTGNPELAVQGLIHRNRPFVALVQPLEPPALSRYLLALRSSTGGTFYEADLRGVRACIKALREGKLVALMADRDIQGTGVCVTLCGRRIRIPKGPFELARRTGATLLPVFCVSEGIDHQVLFVEEPYRVATGGPHDEAICDAAQRWAAALEQHLRRWPAQWKVLEDYWQVHACAES